MQILVRQLREKVGNSKVYVTGHKITDVDSYVSSYLLADMLKVNGFNAEAVLLMPFEEVDDDTKSVVDYLDLPVLNTVEPTADTFWFLVDHNNPIESIGLELSERVVGVIDHHKDDGVLESIVKNVDVIGSTTHLLYAMSDLFNVELSVEQKKQVLLALLIDTTCLMSAKATEEDKSFASDMCLELGLTLEELFQISVFEMNFNQPIEKLAFNGYKEHETKEIKYSSSYVEVKGMTAFKEEKLSEIFAFLKANHKLQFHFILVGDLSTKRSFVKIIGDAPKGIVDMQFDFLASRGSTVVPKIKEILTLN